jgi:hypothetical protein
MNWMEAMMAVFRVLLVGMLLVLGGYTALVIGGHGLDLFPVFIGNILAVGWSGQFNLDFAFLLALTAIWIAWRHEFSVGGIALGALVTILGVLLLASYLLVVSLRAKGDARIMALGERRAAR